jgi:hypothetical protein
MKDTTEAYFINHCDEPSCCIGSFEYTCPNCKKNKNDYDIFYMQDKIHNGSHIFKCEECKISLKVEWVDKELNYIVNIKNK